YPRLRAILLSGHLVLSFLQPLTEFERSSLTHPSFAELLKLNPPDTPSELLVSPSSWYSARYQNWK
ncbi:MAG: hypothetical protein ACR2IV_20635, partial [Bryobacteraceae bacterium]